MSKVWVCCHTYYGEFRHELTRNVNADTAEEATEKARYMCGGMRMDALGINAYPYVNAFPEEVSCKQPS